MGKQARNNKACNSLIFMLEISLTNWLSFDTIGSLIQKTYSFIIKRLDYFVSYTGG